MTVETSVKVQRNVMSITTPASVLLRVLIVEDSVDAAEILALVLTRKGHVVETAHSGAEAIAAARRMLPDVVLLDLGLPDMDGGLVAEQLATGGVEPVVIAVTGFSVESRTAFAHHLVKPIDIAALDAILADVKPGSAT